MKYYKKLCFSLLIIMMSIAVTGCIHQEATYEINKDGSGSISVILTISEAYSQDGIETGDNVFGMVDSSLNELDGMNIEQMPFEEIINGEKFIGTKINMDIVDMNHFILHEGADTLIVENLANGNKRLEFIMTPGAETTEVTNIEPSSESPEQKAQMYAAMKELNTKLALHIKTDYQVVSSNATSSANGLYTWDLLEMSINSSDTDVPSCYIEYVPVEGVSEFYPATIWLTAKPTTSKVTVNGKMIEFDAYNINGNNYFKLRDVAEAINGSQKQFNVEWDAQMNAINLTSNSTYKRVGGELAKGDGISKSCRLNQSAVYKDGNQVELKAYHINGNNYFKLRDLGDTFNLGVNWNNTEKTVEIDTSATYTSE